MKNANYRDYSVDDLARDELFRDWVINRNAQSERFWREWLDQNPDCADKVQLAQAFLLALEEKNKALSSVELDQIFTAIVQDNSTQTLPFWRTTVFRVAATVLLVLGVGYLGFVYSPRIDRGTAPLADLSPALATGYLEISCEGGRPRTMLLPDSSRIVLYPNARLRYPRQFDASKREVYLSGRAFFSVKKNPKQPFWVFTDQISTQVLGTSFLVTTDARQARVEVRSGRVSVYMRTDVKAERPEGKHESAGVVLTPNQQVVFSTAEKRLVKSVVEQPITLQNTPAREYLFDETPIPQVFTLLERTYGLPVVYDAASLQGCYLTANLTGESLFDKLNLICKITRSSYELVDGQIVIHSKGCEN